MNDTIIAKSYLLYNIHRAIDEIKAGIKCTYVENMIVNNEEILSQEICKLDDNEFRCHVKTAIDCIISKYSYGDDCFNIKRYVSRMNTKQMKKIFNYNEINDFYINEVTKQLCEQN